MLSAFIEHTLERHNEAGELFETIQEIQGLAPLC
jgi:hypothetical protein